MHDIVTAILRLCRRYVKWAEEMLLCTEEYRKTKISPLRNTSTPISKTAWIEKIFLRKILCRKNIIVRLAEIHSHPSCGFFCAQNRTSKNAPAITIKNIVLTSAISLVTYLIVWYNSIINWYCKNVDIRLLLWCADMKYLTPYCHKHKTDKHYYNTKPHTSIFWKMVQCIEQLHEIPREKCIYNRAEADAFFQKHIYCKHRNGNYRHWDAVIKRRMFGNTHSQTVPWRKPDICVYGKMNAKSKNKQSDNYSQPAENYCPTIIWEIGWIHDFFSLKNLFPYHYSTWSAA